MILNRNTPANHFDLAPSVGISRSRFNRDFSVKTSFDVGQLVPIYVEDVLPGDTFDVKTAKVARLQTLKTPVYDNIYLDTYFFYVPNRLLWEHWENLMGANTESAWAPVTEYSVPQVAAPEGGWNVGTIADYIGVPTGVDNISVSALYFRAYCKIVEDWFRDESTMTPIAFSTNDSDITGSNGSDYITDLAKGAYPFIACKLKDYFTSSLPQPQRGESIQIPLSGVPDNIYPVFTQGSVNSYYSATSSSSYPDNLAVGYPIAFDNHLHYSEGDDSTPGYLVSASFDSEDPAGFIQRTTSQGKPFFYSTNSNGDPLLGETNEDLEDYSFLGMTPVNLVANVPAMSASINQLRLAFQIQRLLERDARSGCGRYTEILAAHFSVKSPDARLQRSEYLGGKRCPLNISQVTQLGATNEVSPLGDVAGMSVTTDLNHDFVKSFTEHGIILGLAVARYDHTYQQGLPRFLTRKSRFDFYWPVLANIGEQPLYTREIYCTGTDDDDTVFGYQEAWADYRYHPNIVTGEMRSSHATSLDIWHFGDDYNSAPVLSAGWMMEDKSNVDRTLAVTSAVSNQIFADFYFTNRVTRPMPLYSIPGLIDHN